MHLSLHRLASLFLITVFLPGLAQAQASAAKGTQPAVRKFSEPAWFDQGLVIAGNWEPLDYRTRMGGQGKAELPVDLEADYLREHSEETVLQLKAAGVNLVITHFYKMGLAADAEDIAVARKFVALCHQHGLKVGAYIGGTIFAETLLRDVPEARNWVAHDEYGVPICYGAASYRLLPDFNHPGYVDYMKKVVQVAVADVKFDLLHFDNMLQTPPPGTTSTVEVNGRFRAFLQEKYTPAQLKNRLGFSDLRALTVPSWHALSNPAGLSPINDPLAEEWIDFRCQDLADYYGKIADYARQLNSAIVLELNCAGLGGANQAFLRGVDHARLVTHGSAFFTEEQNDAQVDGSGALLSKIRSYKLARKLRQTAFTYDGPPQYDTSYLLTSTRGGGMAHPLYRTLTAESMAFNRNCFGMIGWVSDAPKWPADLMASVRFYHEQNRHYQATHPVADVAVLRSFPSMAYNSGDPQRQTALMEQLLIQYKVPFDIIGDDDVANLSSYRVLVIASQEAISDRTLGQIDEFVRKGGGLVVTGGRTSLLNDWRRERKDYGLSAVLGIHYQPGTAVPSAHRQTFGEGRTAYLPRIETAGARRVENARNGGPAEAEAPERNALPLPTNAVELMEALRYAAAGPFAVEFTDAPLTTVMELTDNANGTERVLHWLNYKLNSSVPACSVTVAVPAGKNVAGVELISPDRAGAPLEFSLEGSRVRFTIPAVDVYNVAVISFR